MNRARRTALTATIAAVVVGGASAIVAASAAEPTAGGGKTPSTATSTAGPTGSTADPREAALRESVRRLEDRIAALKARTARAAGQAVATRTTEGPRALAGHPSGHPTRGGRTVVTHAPEPNEHATEHADETDEPEQPDETDEPDDD